MQQKTNPFRALAQSFFETLIYTNTLHFLLHPSLFRDNFSASTCQPALKKLGTNIAE
jgi:hypothetical protein